MDSMRWLDKPVTFRSLVDNPAVRKPVLVQIASKSVVVGEKFSGEFISASQCRISNNRRDVRDKEFVLSSKHSGIWKIISKATTLGETHIHRLTTKDIERIYKQDLGNGRSTPRTYICTKDVEAFELLANENDSNVVGGRHFERKKKCIEENVEFEVTDIGEVEYTPTEGERTSQDYVAVPKNTSGAILELFLPGIQDMNHLIRNRVLRILYCTTRKESHKRRFLLEVNEQACDIRPIASEGSTELRYLHSTKNLFDYLLNHGTDTFLYVKLLRGDMPAKAIEYDGYLVFKAALDGERIPLCRVDNCEVTMVHPDFSARVKVPSDDKSWRSIPDVHAAERQCMQLSLSLLSRYESEMYVTVEMDKSSLRFLQSNQDQYSYQRQGTSSQTKQEDEYDLPVSKSQQHRSIPKTYEEEKRQSKPTERYHAASDKLYHDDGRRSLQEHLKAERQRIEKGEKYRSSRATTRDKTSTSLQYNNK